MKKVLYLPLVFLAFSFFACSDDDTAVDDMEDVIDDNASSEEEDDTYSIISEQISNLHADAVTTRTETESIDSGEFTKFDFETGSITDSDTDWDIAFRTTAIALNGGEATGALDEPERNAEVGVAIVEGTFSEITSAENLEFSQDSVEGFAIPKVSEAGWYSYNFMTNIVDPIPGLSLIHI